MTGKPATYVTVDLQAIAHNVKQVIGDLIEGSRLCAVVKANAYGHGMAPVAGACVEAGAQWLAVSTVDEAVTLRQTGLTVPVLVFMPPLEDEAAAVVEHDLVATVVNTRQVMELRRQGEHQGKVAQAHVYEDLGLGRLGPDEGIIDIVETAQGWPHMQLTGVYSHMGPPGSGMNLDAAEWVGKGAGLKLYAAMLFDALGQISDARLMFHIAASTMFLDDPHCQFDMVRIGTLLYGQYPDHVEGSRRTLDLREAFELCSTIVQVHTVPKGSKVGYGGDYVCSRQTRVATVPVGFAHGLAVLPESSVARPRYLIKSVLRAMRARRGKPDYLPQATVHGHLVPIIGRVSMDQCCLDVTDVPEALRGSPVVLPSKRVITNPSIPRLYPDPPEES